MNAGRPYGRAYARTKQSLRIQAFMNNIGIQVECCAGLPPNLAERQRAISAEVRIAELRHAMAEAMRE